MLATTRTLDNSNPIQVVESKVTTLQNVNAANLLQTYTDNIDSSGTTLSIGSSNATSNVNLGTGSGVQTVNVGTGGGTTTINLGASGDTVNVAGTLTYINTTNLNITDKLITVNKGGGASSASGTGIEIEEAGSVSGYIKSSTDRLKLEMKAPGLGTVMGFNQSLLTSDSANFDTVTLANACRTTGMKITAPSLTTNNCITFLRSYNANGTPVFNISVSVIGTAISCSYNYIIGANFLASQGVWTQLRPRSAKSYGAVFRVDFYTFNNDQSFRLVRVSGAATAATAVISITASSDFPTATLDLTTVTGTDAVVPALFDDGGVNSNLTGEVTSVGNAATVVSVGGSTAAAIGTGVVLANASSSSNTANTIVKRDGSGNFTTNGITLASTGATASLLDFYASTSFSTTFTGPNTTASIPFNVVRIGKLVTLTSTASATVTSNVNTYFTSTTAIPTAFRPTTQTAMNIKIFTSTSEVGRLAVDTNGLMYITLLVTPNFPTATNAGFDLFTISYALA